MGASLMPLAWRKHGLGLGRGAGRGHDVTVGNGSMVGAWPNGASTGVTILVRNRTRDRPGRGGGLSVDGEGAHPDITIV